MTQTVETRNWNRNDGKYFKAVPKNGEWIVALLDGDSNEEEQFLYPFKTQEDANEVAKMLAETFNDGWYEQKSLKFKL